MAGQSGERPGDHVAETAGIPGTTVPGADASIPAALQPRDQREQSVGSAMSHPDEMPLGGYAVLLGVYAALGGALVAFWSRRGDEIPSGTDAALFGIATHKIGRIITRDWVTAPLRAPFTEYVGSAGGGEVNEHSRGSGLQRAIGDLLTCPWCIAPWVAAGLYSVFLANPRAARLIATGFTSVAISDVLQHVYGGIRAREGV